MTLTPVAVWDAGATAAGAGAGLVAAFEALFDATLMPFLNVAAGLDAALLLSDCFDFVTAAAAADFDTFIHLAWGIKAPVRNILNVAR